jgi:hypothetical protein
MNLLLFSINFAKLLIGLEVSARACGTARAECHESELEKCGPTSTLEKNL